MSVPKTSSTRYRPWFWEEFTQAVASHRQGHGRRPSVPAWAERGLRSLRDGLGREPGSVPDMRHLHRVELTDSARTAQTLTDSYRAEHAVLTLFGLHQNSGAEPAHRPGTGLGTAIHGLRGSMLSGKAAERRLIAAATAPDLDDLVQHLRGLVPLLRYAGIGLDYTRLYRDLLVWNTPHMGRVLRAWGLQYGAPAPCEQGEEVKTREIRPYWADFDPQLREAGAQLAALRQGVGREAGTVPAMWPHYSTHMNTHLRNKGALTRSLIAEHAALTIFALHQQGRQETVHTAGITPGRACRLLLAKDSGADRTAIERRLGVLLTSQDTPELAQHLRGLVPLLRRQAIGLDYDELAQALRRWDDPQKPEQQSRLRSRWDRDFHTDAPTGRD
ncbi:type I-E CRISPR-associated protein Cse2/CasB [Streptomyces sp. NPDC001073]